MVADASDLSRGQFWGRLYPDSCDEGFGIRSDKTGKVEYFFLADEIRDNTADNELLAMEFLPIVSALEQTGLKVIVLND